MIEEKAREAILTLIGFTTTARCSLSLYLLSLERRRWRRQRRRGWGPRVSEAWGLGGDLDLWIWKRRRKDELRSGSLVEQSWQPRRADIAADAVQAVVGAGGAISYLWLLCVFVFVFGWVLRLFVVDLSRIWFGLVGFGCRLWEELWIFVLFWFGRLWSAGLGELGFFFWIDPVVDLWEIERFGVDLDGDWVRSVEGLIIQVVVYSNETLTIVKNLKIFDFCHALITSFYFFLENLVYCEAVLRFCERIHGVKPEN